LNEGRGRQLVREVEPWFIVVFILSTPQANLSTGLVHRFHEIYHMSKILFGGDAI
jgi:hypothetical protein